MLIFRGNMKNTSGLITVNQIAVVAVSAIIAVQRAWRVTSMQIT
jgi:hypothetical protein